MGRYDYDDMPAKNNSRGGKGNRRTALATVFFILVALIVLVIYLIANPQESVDIAAKDGKTAVVSADTPTKETADSEKPRLITLTSKEEENPKAAEDTETTGNTETMTPAEAAEESYPLEEPASETLQAEEEANFHDADGSAIEEEVIVRVNPVEDTPVIDEEIITEEETVSTEKKPVEDEPPVIEEEIIVEEIIPGEETPLTEEVTETEDETPVVEEEIIIEEITPEEDTPSTEEVTIEEEEIPVVEEEIIVEEITPEEETTPTDEKPAEDETPVIEEEIIIEEITPEEETIPTDEKPAEDEPPAIEEVSQIKEPLSTATAEENQKAAEEVPAHRAEESILSAVDPQSVVTGGEAHFEDGVLVIKGKSGSAVKAVSAGTVTKTGRDNGLKYVVVTDDGGVAIRYTGFERVLVKLESRVKNSAVLGSIGSSTSSTIRLSVENDV